MMRKYDDFDAMVVEAIMSGRNRLSKICHHPPVVSAGGAFSLKGGGVERLTDRRLQALKKAGRIAFTSAHGWHMPGEVA